MARAAGVACGHRRLDRYARGTVPRGAVIAWFALVAVANLYMSLFARLRVDIKSERLEVERKEQETITAPAP